MVALAGHCRRVELLYYGSGTAVRWKVGAIRRLLIEGISHLLTVSSIMGRHFSSVIRPIVNMLFSS